MGAFERQQKQLDGPLRIGQIVQISLFQGCTSAVLGVVCEGAEVVDTDDCASNRTQRTCQAPSSALKDSSKIWVRYFDWAPGGDGRCVEGQVCTALEPQRRVSLATLEPNIGAPA